MDQTLLTQLPFSVQNTGIILDLPKSRSKAQEDEGRIISPFFLSLSVASLMVHVGGIQYGAGACLFLPNEERIDLKQPVSKRSSILLGELMAIKIALDNIKLEMKRIDIKKDYALFLQ